MGSQVFAAAEVFEFTDLALAEGFGFLDYIKVGYLWREIWHEKKKEDEDWRGRKEVEENLSSWV